MHFDPDKKMTTEASQEVKTWNDSRFSQIMAGVTWWVTNNKQGEIRDLEGLGTITYTLSATHRSITVLRLAGLCRIMIEGSVERLSQSIC